MPFFSRVFKHKDQSSKNETKKIPKTSNTSSTTTTTPFIPTLKPRYASTWTSTEVVLEEVDELLHICTVELKSRADTLDTPFLLLPFRPESDGISGQTFIRNFFKSNKEAQMDFKGELLQQEVRLSESAVLCSVVKWCWSRIPKGVVSWSVYESFKLGEKESGMAINAFDEFIKLAVECEARQRIIYDFLDLLSAVAAHAKTNGMGGRKLSRMAGWWAFEQMDKAKGFDQGYRTWAE